MNTPRGDTMAEVRIPEIIDSQGELFRRVFKRMKKRHDLKVSESVLYISFFAAMEEELPFWSEVPKKYIR